MEKQKMGPEFWKMETENWKSLFQSILIVFHTLDANFSKITIKIN